MAKTTTGPRLNITLGTADEARARLDEYRAAALSASVAAGRAIPLTEWAREALDRAARSEKRKRGAKL